MSDLVTKFKVGDLVKARDTEYREIAIIEGIMGNEIHFFYIIRYHTYNNHIAYTCDENDLYLVPKSRNINKIKDFLNS